MNKVLKFLLEEKRTLLFLVTLCILLSFPFFSNTLISGHDTEVHGVRLINYYLAIKQGQFPPQWAPNMHHGFGYPVFIFSYHLPYLLGQIPFILTKSVELSINFLFILSIFFSVFGSYFLAKAHASSEKIRVLTSLLYSLSPYFLLTIYIRGAVAEALFLGLLPIGLLFLTKNTNDSVLDKIILFIITSSILLSHHIALLLYLPLIFMWMLFNLYKQTKKSKIQLIERAKIIFLSIISTSFYWLPALLNSNLVEVTGTSHLSNEIGFLKISQLFWSLWDCKQYCYANIERPLPTFLGLASFSVLLVSAKQLVFGEVSNKIRHKLIFWLSTSVITIFLMFKISFIFWHKLPIISMIEFPWLLLWIPTVSSVFCLLILEKFLKKEKTSLVLITVFIISQSIFALLFWKPQPSRFSNSFQDWSQFGDIMKNYDGLIPKGFDVHQNLKLYKDVIIRLEGNKTYSIKGQEPSNPNQDGEYEIISWTGTSKEYTVSASQSASVIQKTTYFPGWHAYVDNIEVKITSDDQEFPGRVIIPVKEGEHKIKTAYKGDSFTQRVAKVFSILGFWGMAIVIWKAFKPKII